MKIILHLTMVVVGISALVAANDPMEMSWEAAQKLLGKSADELQRKVDYWMVEYPIGVDEDESRIFTQSWKMTHREGASFLVQTDDGIATVIELIGPEVTTDRGTRVGDSLAEVKRAYPRSMSFDGSTTTLSTAFRLYAEDGNISFTFDNDRVWRALRQGETISVDDPRVRDEKVWLIAFRDGDRFACDEEYPCSRVPDWIKRE